MTVAWNKIDTPRLMINPRLEAQLWQLLQTCHISRVFEALRLGEAPYMRWEKPSPAATVSLQKVFRVTRSPPLVLSTPMLSQECHPTMSGSEVSHKTHYSVTRVSYTSQCLPLSVAGPCFERVSVRERERVARGLHNFFRAVPRSVQVRLVRWVNNFRS